MTNGSKQIRSSMLMIEVSQLLFSIRDIQIKILECNQQLAESINNPSLVIDQAALREQIKQYQDQISAILAEVKTLREGASGAASR